MAKLLNLQKKVGKAPLIAELLMPVLFLLAVLLVDHSIPGSSITTSCLTIALLCISLFQAPGWLVYSGVIFSSAVLGVLFCPFLYEYVSNREMVQPVQVAHYTRLAAFVLLSCFCVIFSVILHRFRNAHDEMMEIITRFTKPLFVCEMGGKILLCNTAAEERFHLHALNPQNDSIVDLFAPRENKGVFISQYIKAFEDCGVTSTGEGGRAITLHFEGKELRGEPIRLISSGSQNIILTVSE